MDRQKWAVTFGVAFLLSLSFLYLNRDTPAQASRLPPPAESLAAPAAVAPMKRVAVPMLAGGIAALPTDWLGYSNWFRATAGLPALSENRTWDDGDWKHSRYTVKNDLLTHGEDPAYPWYTPEGNDAALNGNITAVTDPNMTDALAIEYFMQAPFHAVGILDPHLTSAGFGRFNEAGGSIGSAATMDVIRGRGSSVPPSVQFPILWPGNGKTVPLRQYVGGEVPDPLTSCSGYSAPSGLPLVVQLGAGYNNRTATASTFKQGSTSLTHCRFDPTNYYNPNSSLQSLARSILNARDAVVIVPKAPLTDGATYTASVTSSGQTYTWSFTVSGSRSAPANDMPANNLPTGTAPALQIR